MNLVLLANKKTVLLIAESISDELNQKSYLTAAVW